MLHNFNFSRGEPAIKLEELKLPSGEYANKYSLLRVLADAGLPVARIITPEELDALSEEKLRKTGGDPDACVEDEWRYEAWRRGYWDGEEGAVDNWAVDTLSSQCVGNRAADNHVRERIERSTHDHHLMAYLNRNFGTENPRPASFLQAAVNPSSMYVSTWEYSDLIFTTVKGSVGGIDACYTREGKLFAGCDDGVRPFHKSLFPLQKEVSRVLNRELGGDFCYKVDYLFPYDSLYILQARVASRHLFAEEETLKVENLKAIGVPVINLDLAHIRNFRADHPFILSIINTEHRGDPRLGDIGRLDLSQMQALILPSSLEGALLRHHGYIFISYALYWGLPLLVEKPAISL